jgi:O-methyltransferase
MAQFSSWWERYKRHPRRFDPLFVLGTPVRRYLHRAGIRKERETLLQPPIDTSNVAILRDEGFQRSVREVSAYTKLDVARLANLWQLSLMAGPGTLVEIGSFQGGGAKHIGNARPGDSLFCFDPFESGGFEKITKLDDHLFQAGDFTETSHAFVERFLGQRKAPTKVVKGYFPQAAEGLKLEPVAFCHLDVDVYEATARSLEYLRPRLGPKSLIVLDDYCRNCHGVDRAVADFLASHPEFRAWPLFPGQGVLFSLELWR